MKNRYGVDTSYFRNLFERELRNLADYRPDELARVLARMAKTADSKVLMEREFTQGISEGLRDLSIEHGKLFMQNRTLKAELKEMSNDGRTTAFELLDAIGKKAGVEEGDVAGLLEWIDKLPDPD